MLLLRLWNYIRGYVIIVVEGLFLEKFINICTRRQMLLWDVKRQKNCAVVLKTSIKAFKMLKPIARKTNCRIRIIKKKGLPFVFNRYRRRKAFIVGAVLFVLLIYIFTSFIWTIEIMGNREIESDLIIAQLNRLGIKPGVLKYNIDPDKIVNELMLNIKELAWVGVVVKGTKVKIEVAERRKPPSLIAQDVPCNIVARRDGIIKSIIVKDGQPMVKEGDTVIKGQVLVSGAIDIKNEEERKRYVHAIASIKARTWYEKKQPVTLKVTERIKTGNKKDVFYLELFTKRLKIFFSENKFKNYDKIEIEKKICIGDDLILPFGLFIERFYEVDNVERNLTLDSAKNIAVKSAYEQILEDMEVLHETPQIVNKNVDFIQEPDGKLMAVVTVECIEEIGVIQEIGGD